MNIWHGTDDAPRRDPALGVLALIEKWGVETQPEPQSKKPHQRRTNGGVRVRRRS